MPFNFYVSPGLILADLGPSTFGPSELDWLFRYSEEQGIICDLDCEEFHISLRTKDGEFLGEYDFSHPWSIVEILKSYLYAIN